MSSLRCPENRKWINEKKIKYCFTFIYSQQHPGDLKDNALFRYKGHTLAECPENAFQIEFSSNCTETCPGFAPFLFQNVCLAFCPIGYEEVYGYCVKKNNSTPSERNNTKENLLCQNGFCPKEKPFCDEYRCETTCPEGMLSEEFSCVYTCSNFNPIIFNNTCVSTCPQMYPYTENNHCVINCSKWNVLSGNACVKACPPDKYRTDTHCVDSCLSEDKYGMMIWKTHVCLDRCPAFTNINGSICHIQCPRGLDFLSNRSCVRQCPNSMPFVYVLSRRFFHYKKPICLPFCPDRTYIDGRTCVDRCIMGMKIYDRRCVQQCPESHKFVHQQMCISTCPSNFVAYNDTSCLRRCPTNAGYTYHGLCVESCPSGYNILNDKCVDVCPDTHVLFQGECSTRCPTSLFAFNGSCIHNCPKTHPYRGTKVVNIVNFAYAVNACLKVCVLPKPYLYNMTCRYACPSNLFAYNKTCVENCSNVSRFGYEQKCVTTCPTDSVIYNGSCFISCPKQAPFLFNKTCQYKCPSTHALHLSRPPRHCVNTCRSNISYSDRLEFNGTCVIRCPDFTIYFNGTCVDKCPLSHRYNFTARRFQYLFQCVNSCKDVKASSLNDRCTDHCPMFSFNSSCLNSCPQSHRFIYYGETGGNLIRHCVNECPGNTYSLDDKCFNGCPKKFVSFRGNLSCLHQCPTTHKFRFLYSIKKNLFRCEKTCSKPHFISGDQCLQKCPVSKQFLNGQTCLGKCDSKHKFFHPRTKQCLKDCPDPYVISNNTCIQSCPSDSRFLVNNVCTKACPEALKLWSPLQKANICSNTCIGPFVQENNTCVSSCSDEKVIINSKCINSLYCPREYRYVEQSPQGKICRKACVKGQFVANFNCVTKCRKFYVNDRCVDYCPATHPFTENRPNDAKCHDKCPASKYTDGKKCVIFCSDDKLILEDNKTCVKHCPTSHPYRTERLFSTYCVKTCTGSLLIYNNTCMLKSECEKSTNLLIFYDQCVHRCPPHSFLDASKKNCISLTAGTMIAGFVLMAISIILLACVCSIIKCRSPSLQTKIISNSDEALLLDSEDNRPSEDSQEIYDTSSEQNHQENGNNPFVLGQVSLEDDSLPMVQFHREMEETPSSSDQFTNI
ncbi:proprotein convertase subtilisin/kexin type 5-like [Pecten maximus]|uniref:proprotein convertase subtilisin/kexin type 5-like n=1 Tax=Pecten maximus TaxID=6579 RepID=UPI001458AE4A|nr:proprotein convertase subtilisin/kexin type 5-like [Pecten maximus]